MIVFKSSECSSEFRMRESHIQLFEVTEVTPQK
jgi:hypothetical protein